MWWNGWVFSFDKVPKLSNTDGELESSGMDEAINCLDNDDSGMEVSTNRQEFRSQLEENLIETFDSLAVNAVSIMAEHHNQLGESSSGSSRGPPNQPTEPIVLSFAPGPSYMHSVEQQDTMIPEILQAIKEEIVSQNSGKGKGKSKEKAVDNITEVDMQVKKAGGKQRGRPKKTVI